MSSAEELLEQLKWVPQRLYERRPPLLTLPEVDTALAQWVIQKLSSSNARLTGDMICKKARKFCRLLGYADDTLSFSHGWLQSFKTRMGLLRHVFHGEAASAPVERLEDERYRLLSIIEYYPPCNIYNIDESALLYCLVPTCGLAIEKMPGVKLDKKQITYALCANMDGSDKRPPLIIARAKQPRCFEKHTGRGMGFYYFWNGKAWMVHSIWKQFLFDLNKDMRRQGRYILLLYVKFLAPNLTAWVQPMDGGIIASFKAQYKRRFVWFALDRDNQGAANMYKIDQLQAMCIAAAAWNAVTPQTIWNCWNHVGLVPSCYLPAAPSAPAPAPTSNVIAPRHIAHAPAPQPIWYNDVAPLQPEYQHVLNELDLDLLTKHFWTDQEIVDQIIADWEGGFAEDLEQDLDLEDFFDHHNSHI